MASIAKANIELARPKDLPFLWEMLTYAASLVPGGAASVPAAQNDAYLSTYLTGWGRADDLGVVAHGTAAGAGRLGAAWVRSGLILAEPRVPELATAIVPGWRGLGLGAALMRDLFGRATGRFDAIILSVRDQNPALRFYERLGFRREGQLTNRVGASRSSCEAARSWRLSRRVSAARHFGTLRHVDDNAGNRDGTGLPDGGPLGYGFSGSSGGEIVGKVSSRWRGYLRLTLSDDSGYAIGMHTETAQKTARTRLRWKSRGVP